MFIYILSNLLIVAICAFAMRAGSLVERLAGAWMLINLIAFAIVIAVVRQSPLVSLISDGIFSIGLLPLAIFFASWSIGVMCLVQSSSFAMQAWYLVTDRPADMQFITMTSVFCWGVSVALLVSTVTTLGLRRRAEAKDRTRALSRLPQGSQPQS